MNSQFAIIMAYKQKGTKMNIKIKAALQTVGILAVITSISIGVQLLVTVLTAQELSTVLAVISITFLIFGMYQMILGRLEYNQKVDEITKK
jgi:hypothetical protein